MVLLVEGFPRVKSIVRVVGSLDLIKAMYLWPEQVFKMEDIDCDLKRDGHYQTYIPLQLSTNVEGTGKVFGCTVIMATPSQGTDDDILHFFVIMY